MTAHNIVRMRVKPGRQADFENLNREQKDKDGPAPGMLRAALIRPSATNYCFIAEWESYEAMADARDGMAASLALMRPMLEDLGGGLGVTYAVSGQTVIDYVPSEAKEHPIAEGAPPRAYNIVRHRLRADRLQEFEERFRQNFASQLANTPPGLRKFVVVNLGARNYGVIGEWQSFDHLAAARPFLIKGLDSLRDFLEDLGGGLGVTYAVSGEAIVEYP